MKFLNIKLVLIILLGSIVAFGQSPDITELEYYFDPDPGFGNGTSVMVSADTITSTTFDLDISSLDAGIHYAFIRAKDVDGVWSFIHKMIIHKVETLPVATLETIINLEYFFDTDPGYGNGTPIVVVDGTITSTAFNIDISGLSTGFHKVYFRSKNENGIWSLNNVQNIVTVSEEAIPPSTDIVAMEYFYDNDPGFGNGTEVPITSDTVTNTAFDIDVSGLDAGHHKVYVRTKNENEVWGLSYIQNLVKVLAEPLPESPDIIAMEYFIDEDPGFGNGTDVPITADSIIDETFSIDVSGLTPQDYNLYVRVKDEYNNWSLIVVDTFNLAEIELTAYLEGPFSGGSMNTTLNSNGQLPLTQPFNMPPWNYDGDESVVSIPNVNIVDWILMETRNAVDASSAIPGTIIFRRAGFILNDGSIVGLDGTSNLAFKVHVDSNNFVVLYHRNHLGIMSANELSHSGWKYSFDFTTGSGQAYNSGQKDLGDGSYGMYSGDGNADGTINSNDISVWINEAGSNGYLNGDFDLNREVNNIDKNDNWHPNNTIGTEVPD